MLLPKPHERKRLQKGSKTSMIDSHSLHCPNHAYPESIYATLVQISLSPNDFMNPFDLMKMLQFRSDCEYHFIRIHIYACLWSSIRKVSHFLQVSGASWRQQTEHSLAYFFSQLALAVRTPSNHLHRLRYEINCFRMLICCFWMFQNRLELQ